MYIFDLFELQDPEVLVETAGQPISKTQEVEGEHLWVGTSHKTVKLLWERALALIQHDFSMIGFNQCIHICKWIKAWNLPMHMQSLRCPGILEFSRKFQDSKIFRVNLGILEMPGKFQDSKIFRVNLGILEFWEIKDGCFETKLLFWFKGSFDYKKKCPFQKVANYFFFFLK